MHVFTYLSTKPTTSGGDIFRCTFFTNLSTKPTTSGGPIFRCTTKDRGERRAKGLRPLESPGVNVLKDAGRAMCEPFRNGAFDAIKSRMACSALLPCALRAALLRKTARLTQPPNFRLQIRPVILKVPTLSPHYVQYNRVRGNSVLAHATDGPKSR